MLPKNLVVVRHGQSERNAAVKAAHEENPALLADIINFPSALAGLTGLGRSQAIATGEWLRVQPFAFSHWYVSSFVRAKETAGLLDLPGAKWFVENRIRERATGVMEDMTPKERSEYLDGIKNRGHILDPYNFTPDGGESFADVEERMRGFFDTLHRVGPETDVCVVNHGHSMRAIDAIIHHMTPEDFSTIHHERNGKIKNCTVVHYTRIDPKTAEVMPYVGWMRTCTPWMNQTYSPWMSIERRTYSSQELLHQVEEARKRRHFI